MIKIPIVFFGSGPVAAKSLELLLNDFDVIAVVTKPKPAHHRGKTPVLEVSKQHNLVTHTVSNKAELSRLVSTHPFKTDVAILIDFGIIVTLDVIEHFPKGIINSHFSLLPEWRGADPITFSILSGQDKTGVSLMLIDEGMDTGKIIAIGEQGLDGTETSNSLTEKLIHLSDALLKNEVPRYVSNETEVIEQSQLPKLIQNHPSKPTYSRKLTKADGLLDFTKPAKVLEREIRAFLDWPKSKACLAGIDVIITNASVVNHSGNPGDLSIDNGHLVMYCGTQALQINTLKPAGKSEMSAKAFLLGYGQRLNTQI